MTVTYTLGAIVALGDTLVTIVGFIILFWLIKRFAWESIINTIEERERTINADIDKAEDARKTAEKQRKETQEQLQNARNDANEILNRAQKEGNDLQKTIISEAKEDATRMKQQTQREIALEKKQAFHNMRSEIGATSINIAQKIIGREVHTDDHQRLIEEFIEGLEK